MRRASVLLTAIGLVWTMTACSTGEAPEPASTGQPPTAPPPSAAGPSAAAPSPPGGGEVPGPLPWGGRTLTGTVERAGDCTMLLVGAQRFALTGEVAATLSPGAQVTVHGALTSRPAACGERELAQTMAVNRVEPA
ncbi:hypothetical protein ACVCAH_19455 [Micromonospora sp. LZ34]